MTPRTCRAFALFAIATTAACGPTPDDVAATQGSAFQTLDAIEAREDTWRRTLDNFAQGRRSAGDEACPLSLEGDLGLTAADLDYVRGDEIVALSSAGLAAAASSLEVELARFLLSEAVTETSLQQLGQATAAATSDVGYEAVWLVHELGYPSIDDERGLTPGSFRGTLLVYDHDTERPICAADVRETNAPDVLPAADAPERAAFDESPSAYLLADLRSQAFAAAAASFHAVPEEPR